MRSSGGPLPRNGEGEDIVWSHGKTMSGATCICRTSRVMAETVITGHAFDGDHLAGVLIVETEMVDAFRRMSPSELVFDRNTGAVSSEVGISPSCALTWNRYLGMV